MQQIIPVSHQIRGEPRPTGCLQPITKQADPVDLILVRELGQGRLVVLIPGCIDEGGVMVNPGGHNGVLGHGLGFCLCQTEMAK